MSLKSVTPAGGAFGGALAQQAGSGGFTGAYPSGAIGLMSGQGGGGLLPGGAPGMSTPNFQGGPTKPPSLFKPPGFQGGPTARGAGPFNMLPMYRPPTMAGSDVVRTPASPFQGNSQGGSYY